MFWLEDSSVILSKEKFDNYCQMSDGKGLFSLGELNTFSKISMLTSVLKERYLYIN